MSSFFMVFVLTGNTRLGGLFTVVNVAISSCVSSRHARPDKGTALQGTDVGMA